MSNARSLAELLGTDSKIKADDLDVGQIGGRRNLIINGAMQVAQRGTSFSSLSSTQYLLDRWSNKTVTMSFWYRTNIDGVRLRQYATATHDTIPTTNGEWAYRTVTFTFNTLQSDPRSANCATIGFWNSTAPVVNGSYFEVTQVQLEVGTVATPFEHRSYGEELALCQRYYGGGQQVLLKR